MDVRVTVPSLDSRTWGGCACTVYIIGIYIYWWGGGGGGGGGVCGNDEADGGGGGGPGTVGRKERQPRPTIHKAMNMHAHVH